MPRGSLACDRVAIIDERPEVVRADQVLSKGGGSRIQVPGME